ncbi:MAG TPA: Gfo/Idh/MocA family oxidoreductase [Planctomycetaceae bacterium]|nr:Gfo/Idh/MocA family oxidoreductase [Planctomycetaceae bacterium]
MVRIGIVGVGFMGYTHFEASTRSRAAAAGRPEKIAGSKLKGGRVTAIATRDAKKLAGDWRGIHGNFGPPGRRLDLSPLKRYTDYDELLRDPDIDLVDVCLPTNLHEQVVLEAIAAGKHVFVEKPIATDLKAADRMVRAAERAGRLLMVGQVLPFFPEFHFASEAIRSGIYGKLRAAHFRRVITPPEWSRDMADFRKLGGWGIDLHIHDNHFIALVCGVPAKVHSRGLLEEGLVNHVDTHYIYTDPQLTVSCTSGGIAARGLVFGHGFEIYLEQATLMYDAGTFGRKGEWVVNRPLTLFTQDGDARQPKLKGGTEWCSAFTSELQLAVDAVRNGQAPTVLSGALARDALKICHAEARSIAAGRAVSIR